MPGLTLGLELGADSIAEAVAPPPPGEAYVVDDNGEILFDDNGDAVTGDA